MLSGIHDAISVLINIHPVLANFSRRDHLIKRIKHDVPDDVKRRSNFECPFECGVPACHTMMELLKHCESVHEHSLGWYNFSKLASIPL